MGRFEAILLDGVALLCRLFEVNPPGHEPPTFEAHRVPTQDVDWTARRLAPSFFHQS